MDLSAWWPLTGADELRRAVEAAYADPGRGYHDVRHLAEVLHRLDELAAGGADFDRVSVGLAAWFHDAVYDGRPRAEARSAEWAVVALTGVGVDAATVAEVSRLVRLTEDHRPGEDDPNGAALSDADLAVLAAPPDRYAEYVAGVRREYAAVADDDFRRGRAAVLAGLVAKAAIFHTEHGRDHWERAARENLARELASLTA